jgi:DNA-binding transcriptional MocR family regulator
MIELPTAQQELYDLLLSMPPDAGPTLRELGAALNVSFSAIQARLDGLKAKGLVQSTPGAARSLRVIRPGQVWVAVPESRLSLVAAVTDPEPTLADVSAVESWAGQWHRDRRVAGAAEYNPSEVPL